MIHFLFIVVEVKKSIYFRYKSAFIFFGADKINLFAVYALGQEDVMQNGLMFVSDQFLNVDG